jgi:hypothetical protein
MKKGSNHTKESIEKIKISKTGKKLTAEHKQHLRESALHFWEKVTIRDNDILSKFCRRIKTE